MFPKPVVEHAVAAETSGGGATPIHIPVDMKEVSFHFKKEKIKDTAGKVIGEGKKLPSIKASLPVPSAEGILTIVQAGGKELELLQDAMSDIIFSQARGQINELREKGTDVEIKPDALDTSKLSWSFIANLPKSERRGLGISDEDWDAFFADYRAIMPKATGKDEDRIEKHVAIYKRKFATVRNDKKALGVLNEMLALWAANTGAMEDHETVYDYLKKRVEVLLQEEEKVLAEAL